MTTRSTGLGPMKIIIGIVVATVLLCVFGFIGQLLGAHVFGTIEKLPDSAIGITTLYHYWPVYGHVPHVRKSLEIATVVSAVVTIGPFVAIAVLVLVVAYKKRDLHGSARFATPREIRKAGLVGDDQ